MIDILSSVSFLQGRAASYESQEAPFQSSRSTMTMQLPFVCVPVHIYMLGPYRPSWVTFVGRLFVQFKDSEICVEGSDESHYKPWSAHALLNFLSHFVMILC